MANLDGKVAVITGAGNGIGKEIALGFAQAGASIALVDNDEVGLATAQQELSKIGANVIAYSCDVRNVTDTKETIDDANRQFGRIDFLLCVAGIARQEDFFETSEEVWDNTIDTNLKGSFFCAQAAARHMVKSGAGKIVLIGSTSSFITSSKPMVAYDVSKGGVRALTAIMAEWLGPLGINVNAVAPAVTRTELVERIFGRDHWTGSWVRQRYPLGRIAETQDHVNASLFLCSDDADYIHGHTMLVDGGCLLAYRNK